MAIGEPQRAFYGAQLQEACFSILKTELGPDEARDPFKAMELATTEIRSLYE